MFPLKPLPSPLIPSIFHLHTGEPLTGLRGPARDDPKSRNRPAHYLIRIMPAEEAVDTPDLTLHKLTLTYGRTPVFADINLHLPAGQWTALLGQSGIGKSSLLRVIAGLKDPGARLHGNISTNNHIPLSRQIAYMAQTDLLLPWLTAWDNAILGARLRGDKNKDLIKTREQAQNLLEKAGLSKALHLYPRQLSGGMRQRVALVRTLMENKPIVLMDEPFSALDAITRYYLQSLAAELLKDKSVLFITHDPGEAARLGQAVYIMQGQPASLRLAKALRTSAPRDPADPEVIQWQSALFKELSQDAGE